MKVTYRAKFCAMKAMQDGKCVMLVKRNNKDYAIWLDEITDAQIGETVTGYETYRKLCTAQEPLTFRELYEYSDR